MSEPIVLLAVDTGLAAPLRGALLAHVPRLQVESCAGVDVVERCATTRVDLLVLSASIDDTAGSRLLSEVQAFSTPPQAIVVFDDADDERRGMLSRAGAWEHVLGYEHREPAIQPLLGLIDRLLQSDARDARLDAQARQFRALVEASSDGIYILRDGAFAWVNRRFQEMVGYSTEELTNPSFSMSEKITAPVSRAFLAEQSRRVEAGLTVEPRYEFGALKKGGQPFDAQVSIAYLDLEDGRAGALGIMQDITERKSFEQQLLKKNRELQLLNGLSASVNQALALDETLRSACRHILTILGAEAAGITLVGPDRRSLVLRVSEGLPEPVVRALAEVPLDTDSLLATAVRSAEVAVVDDVASDPRIALAEVRARYAAAIVVPLKSRKQHATEQNGAAGDVVGAAFAFLAAGRSPTEADRDLMIAIGNVLGNAVEKASLLEGEQNAVKKLVALDEVALALASTLDADEVALTVARSTHRLFGAMRVLIARLASSDPDHSPGLPLQGRSGPGSSLPGRSGAPVPAGGEAPDYFLPVHVLDDGEPVPAPVPIPWDDTIMGLCLAERRPVQRVRPKDGGDVTVDPLDGRPVRVLAYEHDLFRQGVGTAVAVPILIDGKPLGAIWLGYPSTAPLLENDLQVLSAIGTHVAIATKNATLFEGRERALEELRAAQQKLVDNEKLHAIGLIAHGVAHDFNNVLGSILGRAQLLKSQLQDATLLKHADIIEKAAQDGAETVRRIQEIGRQDRLDDFVAVDAASILADVVELTRSRWSGKAVEVMAEGRDGLLVAGNPSELREVLINLVHNAVDAMPDDPLPGSAAGRILLQTLVDDADVDDAGAHPHVIIRVKDNGTGIPPDVVTRIFDPYFTTKGKNGTGLGLSVSQSIVRRHGGELRVRSSTTTAAGLERGTTFELELPAFVAPPPSSAAAEATRELSMPTARARVLVVDDEENIREILAEMLMTNDHEVITAADGAEALHKLTADEGIDLVFTDLGLPGMSGYDVAMAAKRLRPGLVVALVTGWGATLDPEKARAHGVDMVISKPFRFEQVLSLVDDALAARDHAPVPPDGPQKT